MVLLLNTRPNSGLFGHLVFVSPITGKRPPSPTMLKAHLPDEEDLRTGRGEEEETLPESFGRLP